MSTRDDGRRMSAAWDREGRLESKGEVQRSVQDAQPESGSTLEIPTAAEQQAQVPAKVAPAPEPQKRMAIDPSMRDLAAALWRDHRAALMAVAGPAARHDAIERAVAQVKISLQRAELTGSPLVRVPETEMGRASLMACVLQAARWDVDCSGVTGDAHLVPFWNKDANGYICQLIRGYQGLVKLATRAGAIKGVEQSGIIWDTEMHEYEQGLAPIFRHVPDPTIVMRLPTESQPGPSPLWVYVVLLMPDGTRRACATSWKDIERIRAQVLGRKTGASSPWNEWWDRMALKSALARAFKYMVLDPVTAQALADDGEAEGGEITGMIADVAQAMGGPRGSAQRRLLTEQGGGR